MSQEGIIDVVGSNPQIPTDFIANVGNAVPIANILEILGSVVAAGTNPLRTIGSGNTIDIQAQISQAIVASNATNIGLSAFNSADFTVDANGFVSLLGVSAASEFNVDASTPPGTDPVVPNGSGAVTITGGQVAAGTIANVIQTNSLTANTYTNQIQRSSAQAASTIGANGVSHFSSSMFAVDANGFVTLAGGGQAIDSIAVQTGTSPISPTAAGLVTINGAVVAAGTNPVRTDGTGANTMAVEVQISQAIASADASKIGLSNFDSAAFDVDANGFVQLNGGGIAATSFDVQANTAPGTDPVVPTAAGVVIVNGAAVANHSVVLETRSRAANAYNVEVQYATSAAATDATKSGVAHFDSARFTVDANGFVSASGTGLGQTITGQSGGALNPSSGNWNIFGASTAAGTSPVVTSGTGSTLTVNVQKSQALAATDATKIGLCNFDSARFSVDANGFVTLNRAGAAETITGDSGVALNPTAGNWNILGLSGSKTSGSSSTLTIKSPPFSQIGSTATSALNTGEFVTASVTRTLPASAGLADGDLFIYVCTTANALIIQSVTAQKIRIGSQITAAAGSATSTAIGDAISLRFNATDGFFYAVSVVGNWSLSP